MVLCAGANVEEALFAVLSLVQNRHMVREADVLECLRVLWLQFHQLRLMKITKRDPDRFISRD